MSVEPPVGRPTDAALWTSIERTLRDVVLPGIDDDHTRRAVMQLVGLAMYGRDRGPDPSADRAAELADALDALADNPLVAPHWHPGRPRDRHHVLAACAAALADAVGRDDAAAVGVRLGLRPVLVAHLDQDLAGNTLLADPFRGRLPPRT